VPFPNYPLRLVVGASHAPDRAELAATRPAKANPIVATGNIQFKEIGLGNGERGDKPLRIGVTDPQFDDMGKLLRTMGQGYTYKEVPADDLITKGALDELDIIFWTCGGFPVRWFEQETRKGIRPGLGSGVMREDIEARLRETISRFVTGGGTLYVSDLRKDDLYTVFPDRAVYSELNAAGLADVEKAEKEWLSALAPGAKLQTIGQLIRDSGLSAGFSEQQDLVISALERSSLVQGELVDRDTDVAEAVGSLLRRPATDRDVKTIALLLTKWENEIRTARKNRAAGKAAAAAGAVAAARERLDELRSGLLTDFSGAAHQEVDAKILDDGLRELLGGQSLRLRFPAASWRPARFRGGDVTVLMRGEYETRSGARTDQPLLVRFTEGQGTVIFTSFHNEAQNSAQERELLKYLVFSAVTAKQDALAQKTLLSGGFSQMKQSHSSGKPSVTQVYTSQHDGPVRFALSFAGKGAVLRLKLVAPGGRPTYEKETDETLVVEATGAPAGEWSYTVTALKVPYENFPFNVSVGEGAGGEKTPGAPGRPRRAGPREGRR
jgi:hypothetical protein